MSSPFWSQIVAELTPYTPGEQPKSLSGETPLIKLNTNENPYPPSPAALKAIGAERGERLRLYPDPHSEQLKASISDYYHLSPDQVFIGNGSDEVLAHLFAALLKKPQPILFPDITYSFYPVYSQLYGIEYKTVALTERFEIDVEAYAQPNGGIIFPNPNAPTGLLLPLEAIERLLQQQLKYNPSSVVVMDEAYIDFGGVSAAALVDKYPNLLVVQTFSKSRSLAGLRVGFALGDRALIDALERVKNSFNSYPIDRLASAGAVAALEDEAYFQTCCKKIMTSRTDLAHALQVRGFEVLPSAANFLFVKPKHIPAQELTKRLRQVNIIVRHFKMARIEEFIRISIGTEAEMGALIKSLDQIA